MRIGSLAVAATLCVGLSSSVFAATRGIVPVVGSTEGSFGSHFKTELQLNNRSAQPMTGTIVFHPQGAVGTESDPSLEYELAPHETRQFDDVVVALHATGLGSLDLIADKKGMPTVVARAYNDGGELGTTGATVPLVLEAEAVGAGETVTLIAPSDRARRRFNIGLRSLASGASIHAVVYSAAGVVVHTADLTPLSPETFVQTPAEALLGTPLAGDESIALTVVSGSVIVYSTTTDNTTNDPSLSLGARSDSALP